MECGIEIPDLYTCHIDMKYLQGVYILNQEDMLPKIVSMLLQRLRRWHRIEPALGRYCGSGRRRLFCHEKPKGRICLLVKLVDSAFWLCRAVLNY